MTKSKCPTGGDRPACRRLGTGRLIGPGFGHSGFIGHWLLVIGHSKRAFSLIELIGVLAVIAILAAAAVPVLIRQMDRIAGEQESAALKSFGDALQQSILRKRCIPGTNDWATTIAAELGVDVANITTNQARRQPRFFLIDPAWQIGASVAGQAYTNSSAGSSAPVSPRVMLLSSIGRALPAGIASGVPSSANFNAIWNWTDTGGAVPATSFGWPGWPNSDDLKVQRVNLAPMFVRLLLSTYNSTDSPRYSIDSTNWATAVVITTNLTYIDSYFIQNSILVLHMPRTNTIDSQQILTRDSAFVFDQNQWRPTIGGGSFLAGLDLGSVVDQYLKAPENPNALYTIAKGSNITQQAVVVRKMKDYFDAYGNWVAAGFPRKQGSTVPPTLQAAQDAQVAMKNAVQAQYMANSYNPPPGGVPCP
jgi:prepilin-type N-terminal cleavage/methylation domain-containing protein